MQPLPGESAVNQFGLPWVAACGQTNEQVLRVDQFPAWQAARAARCGHPEGDVDTCRICVGGMLVAEAFGGSDHVKILPMR